MHVKETLSRPSILTAVWISKPLLFMLEMQSTIQRY